VRNQHSQVRDRVRQMFRQSGVVRTRLMLLENQAAQHLAESRQVPKAPESFVSHIGGALQIFRRTSGDHPRGEIPQQRRPSAVAPYRRASTGRRRSAGISEETAASETAGFRTGQSWLLGDRWQTRP
jgi:hypothetical protein